MRRPDDPPAILYCHCAYANVVPPAVKEEVLRSLTEGDLAFDAVADLCEMSARKDPSMARLASSPSLQIVACFPRAVRWLFHAAGAPLPEQGVEVLNMRESDAADVVARLGGPSPSPAAVDDGQPGGPP